MAKRYWKTAQVKFNIKKYLDLQFIQAGLYGNVASGQLSVHNQREDILTRVDVITYESLYDNWIYETDASGIASYRPTVASGCYINGAWHAKGAAPYYPAIDYPNGRILFAAAPPDGAEISAVYSYKHAHFGFPESAITNVLFSAPKTNVEFWQSSHLYPSGVQRQLPVVIIDPQRRDASPLQLGGGRRWTQTVVLHAFANDPNDIDIIIDVLDTQFRKVIEGVDFNDTPQELTYQGDTAGTYVPYTTLQATPAYNWARIYIDDVTLQERDVFFDFYRARVDWRITFERLLDD
jgi:hypothetical protein